MDGMGDMGGMMASASPAPAHDHAAHDKWVARCCPVLHRSTRNPATRPLKHCHLPCPPGLQISQQRGAAAGWLLPLHPRRVAGTHGARCLLPGEGNGYEDTAAVLKMPVKRLGLVWASLLVGCDRGLRRLCSMQALCPCQTAAAPFQPSLPLPHPLTQAQAWGAWWALTLYARYVRCLAAKRPFRTQAWSRLPVGPPRLRAAPLEPLIKVLLPLMGVLGGEGVQGWGG